MTAKLLYLNALRDRDFLRILKVQESQVDELLSIVKSRVILGGERAQILKFFEIRKLEIQDDIRSLSTIFFDEKKALSFLMGVPSEKELKLVDIELPSLEDLSEISFDTFVFRALDNAPEINQYKYIKDSLRFVRREAYFSFLGASSTSRSSSVFNNIPVQDGLGFGMGSSLRIAGSESKILEINMNATKEVIKKNLYNLVNNYNSYLKNIEGQKNRNKYSQENFKLIKGQLVLGGSIDPLEVLTSIESVFDSSISLTYEYEAVTTMEKIKRSIFNDDYSKKESKLHLVIKGRN